MYLEELDKPWYVRILPSYRRKVRRVDIDIEERILSSDASVTYYENRANYLQGALSSLMNKNSTAGVAVPAAPIGLEKTTPIKLQDEEKKRKRRRQTNSKITKTVSK